MLFRSVSTVQDQPEGTTSPEPDWMPKLKALMAGGKKYFVVVGALHLVGPDGLLALFQKDGYKIEQL